jgi:hypothetical protein
MIMIIVMMIVMMMVMNCLNFMGVWLFSNNILTLKSAIQCNIIYLNYLLGARHAYC